MENNPLGSNSFESSGQDSDKPDTETSKKKKKSLRLSLKPIIEEAPVETKEKTDKPTAEKPEATTDDEVGHADAEETQHINSEIAAEHLQDLRSVNAETGETLEPAAEFLEQVQEGTDTETAFAQVAAEYGMTEDEIAVALDEARVATAEAEANDTQQAMPETEPEDADSEDLSDDTTMHVPHAAPPTVSTVPSASAQPRPDAANTMPAPATNYYENRRAQTGQLLVAGLVGYLIGRRRGRIKTEKKLIPVQRKLEQQVAYLERDITFKEQQLVAAKARQQERSAVPVKQVERPAPIEKRMQPGLQETRLDKQKPVGAEHLGHMIMAAEAPKTLTKTVVEKPNNIRQAFRAEEVKMMRRDRLLEISEKIIIEGASLRKIYESNLVGEKQLRNLVSEYLQGKDISKALRKEMVEHEIDFERDPIMRDRVRSHVSNRGNGGGLGDLLAKAGIVDNEAQMQQERQIRKQAEQAAAREQKLKQQKTTTEVAMVTAIVALAITVVVLALTR